MNGKMRRLLSGAVACIMLLPAAAAAAEAEEIYQDAAKYVLETVPEPQVGSIGGEWAVLGLARGGYAVPEGYFQDYYYRVEDYVKDCGGVLDEKKMTQYSRIIVALSAIGKDPTNVAGYDLLTALGDYEKTAWQGINGPIWALLALDCKNYAMPQNPEAAVQATRDMYIQKILDSRLPDGGWSLVSGTDSAGEDSVSEPDITGMALQALAKYQDRPEVGAAIDGALACMSAYQNENAGFSGWDGTENLESCAQMLVALCELGISYEDSRFVKGGNTLLAHLLSYYQTGKGFVHTADGSGSAQMSAEQGLYALAAVKRFAAGEPSLYRMEDTAVTETENQTGLSGKIEDVQVMEITNKGKTFADIAGHAAQTAVEALAERGIINGMTETAFMPDANMSRAEFAAIIARGLGLASAEGKTFSDVPETAWYYPYIKTASGYGIINGVSDTEFDPEGKITREEAAVMVARAAKLCGMHTEIDTFAARNLLAGYIDYVKASDWAVSALAFCSKEDILDNTVLELRPQEAVRRGEIAQMLYTMLKRARLL